MDTLAEFVGLTTPELIQLMALALILIIGLFVLRLFMRITAALFRLGCVGIILLMAAIYLIALFNGS